MEATVDQLNFTFDEQVHQHARHGPPGISYVRRTVPVAAITHRRSGERILMVPDTPVEVLLHRNRKGRVTGILYYYPDGIEGWEEPGNVTVFIDPARQRRGIGTKLLAEALHRWPAIDLEQQSYTEGGLALARRFLPDGP